MIKKWAKNPNRHFIKVVVQMADKHMKICSNLIKKWAEDLNKHFSKKKTYRWPTDTRKGAQHHKPLGKCKSKPHRTITSHLSEGLLSKQ